jgi:hypothetical protein
MVNQAAATLTLTRTIFPFKARIVFLDTDGSKVEEWITEKEFEFYVREDGAAIDIVEWPDFGGKKN